MSTAVWIAFLLVTALLALLTFLPLWRNEHWLVRSLDFPRLQFLVVLAVLLVLQLLLLDLSQPANWGLFAVALAALVWQGWWILPFTPLFKKEVDGAGNTDTAEKFSVMTANVLASNRNANDLLAMVRNHAPDVLVTLESDAWWQEQLDTLESAYPHSLKCPLDNRYGMHVYSRLALEDATLDFLVDAEIPSMQARVILPSGRAVSMHFLHPAPPSPTEEDSSEERDAELIIVARRVQNCSSPVVVTGDLNDVAWSETTRLFRKISGLLDPRVGRAMTNTFHAGYWFMRWPLDHLFHSHHFTLSSIRRLPRFGSDHFPLYVELLYEQPGDQDDSGLEADQDDRALAQDKVRNVQ